MKRLTFLLFCLFLGIGMANAQTTKVTGTVISAEDNEPIIGASIAVKGTTIGTVTNFDGTFSLDVPSSAKTLVISFVGMESQEVGVKPNLRIVLETDNQQLDEVVVVAYGTTKKGSFTGSAGVMKTEQIEKRQVSDITNALSGAVAGVQVQSANGQPGTSAKIKIRGVGSINAKSDPLYVVDGIPFDGDIASLNSTDIESMTVLKDAASTALYGARGANGVIMITTKKGKSGKTSINFDAKVGANSRQVKNYDVMTSSAMYLEKLYESNYNAGIYNLKYDAAKAHAYANTQLASDDENGGIGYQIYTLPDGESLIGVGGKLNPNAKLGYSDGDFYYTPDNWSDEMFSSKTRQEYNLNMSGSTEKANYYVSFGYLDDKGIIDGSGFTRYSTRAKGDYQVKEWLKVGANIGYTYSNSRYPGEQDEDATASSGNAFRMANFIAPVYPLYVRNGDGSLMQNQGRQVYDYGDGVSSGFSRTYMSISNPAGDLIYNKDEYLKDLFTANWYAELTPIKGLTLTARYGLNVDNTRYNSLGNAFSGQSASYGGTAWQELTRKWGFDQQYIATYQTSFNDNHHLDAMIGYDGYSYKYDYIAASGQNLYNPNLYHVNNAIDQRIGYGSADSYATEGYIGRVNYNYSDTYFASVSFRRDGSSRFHPDNRWGNFWSASGAWMITHEEFMENLKWIDMLKLKASFGQQGNDLIGNYYGYIDQFKMTGSNGIFSDGALDYKGNPDLTWETSTSLNIGLDFALFDSRFSGSVEYFIRQSNDMLYYKPIAPNAGYKKMPMNVGAMRNSGLEIDLNYGIIKTKDFTWDVNLNATFIKNKIMELHPDLKGELIDGTRVYTEGESMYRMYLVEYAGVDPETGLAMYRAQDKDGKEITTTDHSIAQNYKKPTDNLLPAVYGGLSTSFTFRGFDLSAQLAYQLGGKIYDSGYKMLMHSGYGGGGTNWHMDALNAWTETNKGATIPRLNSNDRYASSVSDRWITSSNYLALNNVTFGYTLPKQFTTKFLVDRLRVYVVADNVALASARKGLDPRQSFTSATTALYTPIRTISGGISVTF